MGLLFHFHWKWEWLLLFNSIYYEFIEFCWSIKTLVYFCSCFLLTMHSDSIEGIYDTLKQCALISKSAGGIGLNVHCIRSTGSYIAGVSIPTVSSIVGITPMCGKKKNIKSYSAAVWNSFLFSYEISAKSILVLFFWSHLQQKLYMLK